MWTRHRSALPPQLIVYLWSFVQGPLCFIVLSPTDEGYIIHISRLPALENEKLNGFWLTMPQL